MTPKTLKKIKALTAWLNREAQNPKGWTFKIEASGLPLVYFTVDLNGNGQCLERFIVLTMDEIPFNLCLPSGFDPYASKEFYFCHKLTKYFIAREADLPPSDI